ncbi:hypothetical protein [Janibacter sp. GS2]|uniref:hypothetical protein n=1 Tax=Janibacter sp. GS2 TaxID=3442646 RepID=UPI003EB8582B
MTSSAPSEQPTRASRHAPGERARTVDPATPAIRPRPLVVAGAVVAALALAGAAASGERVIEVITVVLGGLVVAVGWPRLVRSPTPVGSSAVLAVTALALGGALLAQDSEPFLEQVPAAVAVGIIAMCLHPLVQASARADLARGLAGTALGVVIIACGGVLTSTVPHGSSPVVVAGIALAVAALVDLLTERPRSAAWMVPTGMLVGGIAALLAHWLIDGESAPWAALVGVVGAGAALSLRRATSQQPAIDGVPGAVAAGVASVLLVGPLLHLVSRLPVS